MKKNIFALCVAASLTGFAGVAAAQDVHETMNDDPMPYILGAPDPADQVIVSPGGVGHTLIMPYYTVQEGRNTLLNIINTDPVNGKVVKVHFRGARDSDDVFNFYIFLSPGENWRARVYPDGQRVRLDVSGSSACTLPDISQLSRMPFSTERVFEHRESEVREGTVSLITAANIPPGSALFKAIKHDPVTGVATCASAPIDNAMVPLTTLEAARKTGLDFPTSGLMGQWAITRVSTNSTISGNMMALLAEKDGRPAEGNIIVSPQSNQPVPASWVPAKGKSKIGASSDPLFLPRLYYTTEPPTPAAVVARYSDFPDLSTIYTATPVYPDVQAQLIADRMSAYQLQNEFTTGAANFQTDWVISMPMRRFEVGVDYKHKKLLFAYIPGQIARPVFTPQNTYLVERDGVPTILVRAEAQFWDMNERGSDLSSFSPGKVDALSGVVTVLSFNRGNSNSVLGAELAALNVAPKQNRQIIHSGWGRMRFPGSAAEEIGLPVIGYAAVSAGGNNLGFAWNHRYIPKNFQSEGTGGQQGDR